MTNIPLAGETCYPPIEISGGEVKRNPASSSIHFLSRTPPPSKLKVNSVISLTQTPLDLQFDSATQSNELQVLNLF